MSRIKRISLMSLFILFVGSLSFIIVGPIQKEAKDQTAILFQDFEGDQEPFTVTENVKGSITDEEAYEGEQSLKYEVTESGDPSETKGSIHFKSMDGPVDVTDQQYLILYIKDTQGSNTMKMSLTDSHGVSSSFSWKSPSTEKDEWVQYHVPVDSFDRVDLSSIEEIRIGQWNEGVYYIDQVIFTNELPPTPPARPEAFKPSGEYSKLVRVELSVKEGNLPIYYTLDGTEPDETSEKYEKPLVITKDVTIKAVAYDPEYDLYSKVSTFEYIIVDQEEVIEPQLSLSSGTYYHQQDISITTPTDNALIYYTLDGSTPTENSQLYEGPIEISESVTIRAIAVKDGVQSEEVVGEYTITGESSPFLKADGKVLRNNYGSGEEIILRGTNVGGWLVMEEWMNPIDSPDQKTTIATLTERFGAEKAWELINVYQDHYWQEEDFDRVKKEGMNVLRLPFTYFEMLKEDGSLKETAFDRLDWFIDEAEKRELYVILDLHGAPGSQNGKDHSGDISHPDGGNLYGNEENMNRTVFLWEQVAERYKDREWVAGYDVLNEPEGAYGEEQFAFYDRLYQAIRDVDPNHTLYFEAIWDPMDLPNPEVYNWDNVVYSYHFYGWDDIDGFDYQKEFTDSKVQMVNEQTNYDVPLLVGEFTLFNNIQSWDYALRVYEEQGWNYTTWTYKVTGYGSSWGLYTGEPPRVNIHEDSEEEIREKWSQVGTDTSYIRNNYIADTLRNYLDPQARTNDERFLIEDFEETKDDDNFKTGDLAQASLDRENKAAGEASVKVVVQEGTDIDEKHILFESSKGKAFDLSDNKNSFPNYLVFDVYNSTNTFQRAYVTLVDSSGDKASAWTHEPTKAMPKSWSKVPLLLSSVEGKIDLTEIVEIRIAFDQAGTYNIDNIFVGQSFANDLPKERIEFPITTDPDEEDPDEEDPDEKDEIEEDPKEEAESEGNEEKETNDDSGEENETDETPIENESDESDKDDPSPEFAEDKETDEESGEELPQTATNIFNYIFVGLFLIGLGSFIFLRNRKQSQ